MLNKETLKVGNGKEIGELDRPNVCDNTGGVGMNDTYDTSGMISKMTKFQWPHLVKD